MKCKKDMLRRKTSRFKEFPFVSDAKYVPHLHSIEETLLKHFQKL
jgi:hypothetical protein